MAVAKVSVGSTLSIGTGSPIVYSVILGVKNLDGPTVQVKDLDATGINDTAPNFIADAAEWQPVSFDLVYMAPTAVKAAGSLFTWNGSGVCVKSFKIGGSRSTPDLTTLCDAYYKKGSGLPDYGNCELEGFYDQSDTQQAAMLTDLRAGTKRTGIITLSNGDTFSFTGYCNRWGTGAPLNEGIPWRASVRVTSAVQLVSGSILATHLALKTNYDTKDSLDPFKIVLTDAGAAILTFLGSVSTWEISGAVGGLVASRCSVTIDGDVTIA